MELKAGLVSVIMSNFNTPEEYLRESIESVLSQTYEDFEFIIVDDCSTDQSVEIIKSYTDERICLIQNDENMGLTKSLNIALRSAKGEYVARMDADDISLQYRLEKQVEFLKNSPNVIVCGTGVELFGSGANKHKDKYVHKVIPERDRFQISLLFGNHINIIHPTAMFNRRLMLDYNLEYNENYLYAQDYRMWISCSRVGECSNIEEVLFKYRIHDKAVSSEKKSIQMDCTRRIIEEQLKWIGLNLPEDWETIHFGLLIGRKSYDLRFRKWISEVINHNRNRNVYNQKELESTLWEKWAEISYYELYRSTIFGKIKVLANLPIRYYSELIDIRRKRKAKDV